MSFKSQHYLLQYLPKLGGLKSTQKPEIIFFLDNLMLHLHVCLWVSMAGDTQGWTATFECGVVFPALLSAGLGAFTMDVVGWPWLAAKSPSSCSCSWSLCVPPRCFPHGSPAQPWLPGSVLPSLGQAFPGALARPPVAEGLSRALRWGRWSCVSCGSSGQMLHTEAAPSARAATTSWHLHPGIGTRVRMYGLCHWQGRASSLPSNAFCSQLWGASLALPWLRWLLCNCRSL